MKLLLLILAVATAGVLQAQQNDYAVPILAGISNHGQHPREPYLTGGDRAYLIGTQDGRQTGLR